MQKSRGVAGSFAPASQLTKFMPIKRWMHYEFSYGPYLQTIYSEAEMAAALGMTVSHLRAQILSGRYSYHCTTRDSQGRERYEFQPESWEHNLAVKASLKRGARQKRTPEYWREYNNEWNRRKRRERQAAPDYRPPVAGLTGEQNSRAKLTWPKVRQIRKLHPKGHSTRQLAQRFGVAQATITAILQNRTWKE